MSATNSTPIINLPLFIGTDKPAWLTDWNGAMNIIDTAIANLQTAESGTATSLASLAQSVEALSGTVSQHTTAIQTVTTATATNTGSINTITSLIGNGLPTTTDKTIIGAINEIYGEIGGGDGIDADEVNYDNTSSGLTATDVQAAIDKVVELIPSAAEPITVDATDKTWAAILAELETAVNTAGATISDNAYIALNPSAGGTTIFRFSMKNNSNCIFVFSTTTAAAGQISHLDLTAHTYVVTTLLPTGTTVDNMSSQSATGLATVKLYV